MPTALIVLAPGAEETETVSVADILVRGGCEVTLAHTGTEAVVTGSRGILLAGHRPLAEVGDEDFDLVYLPGGGDCAAHCSGDERVQDLIEGQLSSGRLLAVICASTQALIPRGLARDRRVTSYPAVRDAVEAGAGAWVDERVVEDGNLITSQGPGTAIELGLTLLQRLVGADVAREVGDAMLVADHSLRGPS